MTKDEKLVDYDWLEFIGKARKHFGDNNLILTLVFFKNGKEVKENTSTFGSDNIENLYYWGMLMKSKFVSKTFDCGSLVIRRFLPEKNNIKEIYHVFFTANKMVFFDKQFSEESQNTNAITGEILEPEENVFCCSSIDLFNNLTKKEK